MSQDNWRFCVKCFSLWFAGNPDKGLCPAGGVHLPGTGNYSLQVDSGPGQGNWRWCHKCQGLFFNGNVTHGVCAAGGGRTTLLVVQTTYCRLPVRVRVIGAGARSARDCSSMGPLRREYAPHGEVRQETRNTSQRAAQTLRSP